MKSRPFRVFVTPLLPLLVALAAVAADTAPKAKPGTAAPSSSAVAADDAPRIRLKWTTSTEVDNYGFLVLRGDEENGPFREMTPKVIPGAGNSEVPRDYSWEDRNVVPGKTYWYYLESVSSSGTRERFSPLISKSCCVKPQSAASSAAAPPATGNTRTSP